MRKTVLLIGAIALLSASAWAVDGQVLINQSTVMSSGGFPYHITQTGSYKLSGKYLAPLNQQAIQIIASNVTLDLNGFNVTCNFDANYPRVFQFSCLGDGGYGVGASRSEEHTSELQSLASRDSSDLQRHARLERL